MGNKSYKRTYQREYRKRKGERVRAIEKKYRFTNTESVRAKQRTYRLRRFFNISEAEYNKIFSYQNADPQFRLLIGSGVRKASVEHRHSDGLIRGVMSGLLNRCYGIIERMYPKNTAEVLRALARFHEDPPAPKALGENVYGIIGKAQVKKKPVYGPEGTPDRQPRRVEWVS